MHRRNLKEDMNMRPDYKNWMPKGMVASFCGGAAGSWIAALAVKSLMPQGTARCVLTAASYVQADLTFLQFHIGCDPLYDLF